MSIRTHAERAPGGRICLFALAGLAALALTGPAPAQAKPPNVLVIVTDDQRDSGTMGAMKKTRRQFAKQGRSYKNAYVTTPLCCPSRATIYSGLYAHNHGIIRNDGTGFNPATSWPVRLRNAGYATGLFGYYLVGVRVAQAPFDVRVPTSVKDPREPNTLARATSDFLAQREANDSQPWAMVVAAHSPHAPFTVKPGNPRKLKPDRPGGGVKETDLGDKHPSVAGEATPDSRAQRDDVRRGQLRELQSLDGMIGKLMRKLRRKGELSNTLAIFTSDNGYQWGEHQLFGKTWPYLESVEVPLYVRWPGRVRKGSASRNIVANVDIAPTIYEATGVAPPGPLDGRSLISGPPREAILLEYPANDPAHPGWRAYRSADRQYIRWSDGFVEDYQTSSDPAQVFASNLPSPELDAWLNQASRCAGAGCP